MWWFVETTVWKITYTWNDWSFWRKNKTADGGKRGKNGIKKYSYVTKELTSWLNRKGKINYYETCCS